MGKQVGNKCNIRTLLQCVQIYYRDVTRSQRSGAPAVLIKLTWPRWVYNIGSDTTYYRLRYTARRVIIPFNRFRYNLLQTQIHCTKGSNTIQQVQIQLTTDSGCFATFRASSERYLQLLFPIILSNVQSFRLCRIIEFFFHFPKNVQSILQQYRLCATPFDINFPIF